MAEFVERLQRKPYLPFFLALTILVSFAPNLYVHYVLTNDGFSKNDLAVFVVVPMLAECLTVAVVALVWRYSRRSPVFTVQWVSKRRRTDIIGILVIILGVIAVKAFLIANLRLRHISMNDGVLSPAMNSPSLLLILWYFGAVVTAPFAEELFWRGYVQGCLQRLFGNFAAIIVQGVLFALWHLRGLGGTLLVLPLGLVAGVWRYRRGTLVPLMVAHAILNAFVCLGSWRNVQEMQRIKVTHDYGASVEELCTPSNADPNENARFAYERAAALLADKPRGLTEDDLRVWPADLPGAKNRRLRNWLQANEKALAEFKAGTQLPYYCPPYSQTHLSNPMPAQLRSLTFGTLARAQLRAVDGNMTGCITDIVTCCRLGRHLQGPKPLIDQLVGFAVKGMTAERTLRIVAKVSGDGAFLTALQSELETVYAQRPAPIDFKGEKLVEYDLMQKTFTDDGDGKGHIPKALVRSIVDPPPAMRSLGVSPEQNAKAWEKLERKQTMELIDRVFSELDSIAICAPAEIHQSTGSLAEYLRKLAEDNAFVLKCVPPYATAYQLAYQSRASEDALVVVIGILRYRLDAGDLPADLNALVDKGYLKALSADPFSGSAFVYKKVGGDFLLYSLGPDFDDDGGRPIRRGDDSQDGDIVFWPVVRAAY